MKIPWRGAIGLALSVFLLWYAFHGVHWAEVWRDVGGADATLVVVAVIVGNMIFPLRAIRWRPILDPIAPGLPYGKLWRATAVGMMANNILPARAGELVRAFVLSRETTVPFSAAFASLVVDRVFDAVIVLLLVVVAMTDPRFPAGVSAFAYGGTGVLLFLAAGVVGPFEFASVTALGLYGVHGSLAAAWALSYHVLSLIPITLIGLFYVVRSGLQLGELNQLKR